MEQGLKKILSLMKISGGKYFFDHEDSSFVILSVKEYESLLRGSQSLQPEHKEEQMIEEVVIPSVPEVTLETVQETKDITSLSEEEFLERINEQIQSWKGNSQGGSLDTKK